MDISYSKIADIHREEKSKEYLTQLPKGFYRACHDLLRELWEKVQENIRSEDVDLYVREFRNTQMMVEEIIQERVRKIYSHASVGSKPENLTEEEEKLYEKITKERENFIKAVFSGEIENILEDSEENAVEELEAEGGSERESKEVEIEKEEESGPQLSKEPHEKIEEKKRPNFVQVKILKYVEKYRGVDGEVYGPFKEGDVVEIPKEEAEWMIAVGYAKKSEKN